MTLPLRLTLSFCNWKGKDGDLLCVFEKVAQIKLFTLELEFSVNSFKSFLKNKGLIKINAFQKTLKCCDVETLKLSTSLDFSEIVYELPFSLTIDETKRHLDILKTLDKKNLVISYYLSAHNAKQFEQLLDFAVSYGIKKVIIPNPDLINQLEAIKGCFLQNPDLEKLSFIKRYLDKLTLQVHDYFLAKYLGLKDAELFKGCQAGSYMGYVQNGIVYPCKSIPISLGSLFEEDFATIWKRGKEVMEKYSVATLCESCDNKGGCKLGCPGTAFFLNNGKKDPLCEK